MPWGFWGIRQGVLGSQLQGDGWACWAHALKELEEGRVLGCAHQPALEHPLLSSGQQSETLLAFYIRPNQTESLPAPRGSVGGLSFQSPDWFRQVPPYFLSRDFGRGDVTWARCLRCGVLLPWQARCFLPREGAVCCLGSPVTLSTHTLPQ